MVVGTCCQPRDVVAESANVAVAENAPAWLEERAIAVEPPDGVVFVANVTQKREVSALVVLQPKRRASHSFFTTNLHYRDAHELSLFLLRKTRAEINLCLVFCRMIEPQESVARLAFRTLADMQ